MATAQQHKDTSIIGTRTLKDKERLLQSGAIFVFQQHGILYMVFTVEIDEVPYCLEAYYHEEDYICVYECSYASLESLEAQEPFDFTRFSIVYLLPAAAPLDAPERSTIIQRCKRFAGLDWTVDSIDAYPVSDAWQHAPGVTWQAWLVTMTRPSRMIHGMEDAIFLLVLYDGTRWNILKPIKLHAGEGVKAEFFVPGWIPQDER